jgi:hypothetical protein
MLARRPERRGRRGERVPLPRVPGDGPPMALCRVATPSLRGVPSVHLTRWRLACCLQLRCRPSPVRDACRASGSRGRLTTCQPGCRLCVRRFVRPSLLSPSTRAGDRRRHRTNLRGTGLSRSRSRDRPRTDCAAVPTDPSVGHMYGTRPASTLRPRACRVLMDDVAHHAGVSRTTVSFMVIGREGLALTDDTRCRGVLGPTTGTHANRSPNSFQSRWTSRFRHDA